MLKPNYETFNSLLSNITEDLLILSGELASNSAWQDVAGTLATNMEVYARLLHDARKGVVKGPLTFPSVIEAIELFQ